MIKNFSDLAPYLGDEDKARELFERIRWPNGPICPHCREGEKVYKLKADKKKRIRPGLYKCGACSKQFTATVGTIFEGSRIPLSKWLYAIYLMCTSKKGVSAAQLQRDLGLTYKSSWFMCHRVRMAMSRPPFAKPLGGDGGVVEVDETYIGGKASNNKHRGHKPKKKAIVLTMVDRAGQARTLPIPNTKSTPLSFLISRNVDPNTHIVTDKFPGYHGIDSIFRSHQSVDHSKEYVRGLVHTNFAESYHSLLKRGIFGTFHHISDRHLPKYLREFEFRWNTRDISDGERAMLAIQGAQGKRLRYKEPVKAKSGRRTGDGTNV